MEGIQKRSGHKISVSSAVSPQKKLRPQSTRSSLSTSALKRLIKDHLMALNLPQITFWEIEEGINSYGSRSLWVWGTVASNTPTEQDFAVVREAADEVIAKITKGVGPLIYLRFKDKKHK